MFLFAIDAFYVLFCVIHHYVFWFHSDATEVRLTNLPTGVTRSMLEEILIPYGQVLDIEMEMTISGGEEHMSANVRLVLCCVVSLRCKTLCHTLVASRPQWVFAIRATGFRSNSVSWLKDRMTGACSTTEQLAYVYGSILWCNCLTELGDIFSNLCCNQHSCQFLKSQWWKIIIDIIIVTKMVYLFTYYCYCYYYH